MTCNPLILHTITPDDQHRYEVWCKPCRWTVLVHNMPMARHVRDQHKERQHDD